MSTDTIVRAADAENPTPRRAVREIDGPKLPFIRLLHVELRKLLDTLAGRWVLGAIGLITAAALILVIAVTDREQLTFASLLQAVTLPQGMLLPVIGVLAATSEWTKRTGLITFTLEPRRLRVAVAKFLAAMLLGLITFALSFGAALLLFLAFGSDTWGISGWSYVGMVGVVALGIAQGVAFGMLLGSTPLAIVAIYVLPTVLQLVTAFWSAAAKVMPWIDPGSAQAPLSLGEKLSGEQWGHLATTTGLWVLLPMVLGTLMLWRREVK